MSGKISRGRLSLAIIKYHKTALVCGGEQGVGRQVLHQLLGHPAYVRVCHLGPARLELADAKLEQYVATYEQIDRRMEAISGQDVFCCTGAPFQRRGHYGLRVIRAAGRQQFNQLLLLSFAGADPDAVLPYNRLMGELESIARRLDFWSVHLFRPSLTLNRHNPNRWGERLALQLGKRIDALTQGWLSRYRPVEAEVVAEAMIEAAQQLRPGIHQYDSELLQKLARDKYG